MSEIELQIEVKSYSGISKTEDIREGAKAALSQLLEPLAGFVFDCGLSVHEMYAIFRAAAVRNIADKQMRSSGRVSISGIAATTGISRAEVSRVLKAKSKAPRVSKDERRQATNKILKIWYEDPRYTDSAGRPAILKVFGRSLTFEALVKKYGGGIPTRALLDELVRTESVELLPDQHIRAKSELAVDRGVQPRAIKLFGERASELLATMLTNMRDPDSQRLIASVSESSVPLSSLPLFRKELFKRGADLLAEVQEYLSGVGKTSKSRIRSGDLAHVTVTLFSHESSRASIDAGPAKKRHNLRRAKAS